MSPIPVSPPIPCPPYPAVVPISICLPSPFSPQPLCVPSALGPLHHCVPSALGCTLQFCSLLAAVSTGGVTAADEGTWSQQHGDTRGIPHPHKVTVTMGTLLCLGALLSSQSGAGGGGGMNPTKPKNTQPAHSWGFVFSLKGDRHTEQRCSARTLHCRRHRGHCMLPMPAAVGRWKGQPSACLMGVTWERGAVSSLCIPSSCYRAGSMPTASTWGSRTVFSGRMQTARR